MKVSQSMIKDYEAYIDEELCGSIFEAKYITKKWDRTWGDSPAKAVGRYFEYILTGGMPTGYKEAPQPEYMLTPLKKKKPDDLTVEDMTAPYRMAHQKAEQVKELMKKSGIEIERAQVYLTKDIFDGNIDAEATLKQGKKKVLINLDIKYSGLVTDKWSKFGWIWTEEQKNYNKKQAAQYQILNDRPLYFLVVGNTEKEPIKLFHAKLRTETLEEHEELARYIIKKVKMLKMVGFVDYPSLEKCKECPLKDVCKNKVDILIPEIIDI